MHRIRYVLRGARTIVDLRFSEQKNTALLKAIPDGIFLINAHGVIGHCFSPAAGLIDPSKLDAENRSSRHFECRYLPNAGAQVLAIVRDVTARKEAQARIHRLAYFDGLTGLPNREWIHDHLAESLAEARHLKGRVALLYIDLDQFKRINDTLGHEIGDALLHQVAERLRTGLDLDAAIEGGESAMPHSPVAPGPNIAERVRGRLARVGGDEFIAVLTGRTDVEQAKAAARRILAILAAPFRQASYELVVTPSIGIAMYEAKASGRNQLRLYDTAMNVRGLKRLRWRWSCGGRWRIRVPRCTTSRSIGQAT